MGNEDHYKAHIDADQVDIVVYFDRQDRLMAGKVIFYGRGVYLAGLEEFRDKARKALETKHGPPDDHYTNEGTVVWKWNSAQGRLREPHLANQRFSSRLQRNQQWDLSLSANLDNCVMFVGQ